MRKTFLAYGSFLDTLEIRLKFILLVRLVLNLTYVHGSSSLLNLLTTVV